MSGNLNKTQDRKGVILKSSYVEEVSSLDIDDGANDQSISDDEEQISEIQGIEEVTERRLVQEAINIDKDIDELALDDFKNDKDQAILPTHEEAAMSQEKSPDNTKEIATLYDKSNSFDYVSGERPDVSNDLLTSSTTQRQQHNPDITFLKQTETNQSVVKDNLNLSSITLQDSLTEKAALTSIDDLNVLVKNTTQNNGDTNSDLQSELVRVQNELAQIKKQLKVQEAGESSATTLDELITDEDEPIGEAASTESESDIASSEMQSENIASLDIPQDIEEQVTEHLESIEAHGDNDIAKNMDLDDATISTSNEAISDAIEIVDDEDSLDSIEEQVTEHLESIEAHGDNDIAKNMDLDDATISTSNEAISDAIEIVDDEDSLDSTEIDDIASEKQSQNTPDAVLPVDSTEYSDKPADPVPQSEISNDSFAENADDTSGIELAIDDSTSLEMVSDIGDATIDSDAATEDHFVTEEDELAIPIDNVDESALTALIDQEIEPLAENEPISTAPKLSEQQPVVSLNTRGVIIKDNNDSMPIEDNTNNEPYTPDDSVGVLDSGNNNSAIEYLSDESSYSAQSNDQQIHDELENTISIDEIDTIIDGDDIDFANAHNLQQSVPGLTPIVSVNDEAEIDSSSIASADDIAQSESLQDQHTDANVVQSIAADEQHTESPNAVVEDMHSLENNVVTEEESDVSGSVSESTELPETVLELEKETMDDSTMSISEETDTVNVDSIDSIEDSSIEEDVKQDDSAINADDQPKETDTVNVDSIDSIEDSSIEEDVKQDDSASNTDDQPEETDTVNVDSIDSIEDSSIEEDVKQDDSAINADDQPEETDTVNVDSIDSIEDSSIEEDVKRGDSAINTGDQPEETDTVNVDSIDSVEDISIEEDVKRGDSASNTEDQPEETDTVNVDSIDSVEDISIEEDVNQDIGAINTDDQLEEIDGSTTEEAFTSPNQIATDTQVVDTPSSTDDNSVDSVDILATSASDADISSEDITTLEDDLEDKIIDDSAVGVLDEVPMEITEDSVPEPYSDTDGLQALPTLEDGDADAIDSMEVLDDIDVEELPQQSESIAVASIESSQPSKQQAVGNSAPSPSLPMNKEEIKTIVGYMDELLEKLPEQTIDEFAHSEYFELYERLFDELGLHTRQQVV